MTVPRIPEALLERYLAGELSPEVRSQLENELAASPENQARLDALRADSAAFLTLHPPGPLVAKARGTQRARSWVGWGAALAGAAAAITLGITQLVRPTEPELGLKGNLALSVYRQTAGGSERLSPDAVVHAGDSLRFEVRAPSDGFVAVLSRDGAGHVSVYYPMGAREPAKHHAAEPVLPGAVGLDATLGFETIYVVYAEKPFALEPALKSLEQTGQLQPDPALRIERFSWTKN
jgi:hypothetical protein